MDDEGDEKGSAQTIIQKILWFCTTSAATQYGYDSTGQ